MIFEAKDITPADYLPGKDGVLRVDPQLQYRLHCHFVMSLSKEAEKEGWTMRLIHSQDGHNDFPGVSVYPPGQENASVLTAYRIEGGLLEELSEEEAKKPYVGRFFTILRIKQRAVAGPLDFHLPAILLEKNVSSAYLGGQEGGYDPAEWAKFMMKMCIITHNNLTALEEIDRKYANVSSH